MKLKVNDWKQAWFESHISERFFQEMSKLERGPVQGLETSAQWTEQIMIEVGQLAQAMIRLEHEGAPEPQIRLAYEKAMRLAALSMHLITALDGTDRDQLRSGAIVRSDPPLPRAALAPTIAPPAAPALAPVPNTGGPAPATAAQPPKLPFMPPGRGQVPLHRAARSSATPVAERTPSAPDDGDAQPGTTQAPIFSSLLQVSGRNIQHSESALHQTILSLFQQGLSRAEIEVVTGEPRHIIEAVLNNARTRQQAGA